jgi:hypothetical protein
MNRRYSTIWRIVAGIFHVQYPGKIPLGLFPSDDLILDLLRAQQGDKEDSRRT